MNSKDFKEAIMNNINEAKLKGEEYIDIKSGDIHRQVGGYPGRNHRMPMCCEVMYSMKKAKDEILCAPPKGRGASLTIRYYI